MHFHAVHSRLGAPAMAQKFLRIRPLALLAIGAAVAFEVHAVVDGGWLFPALFAVLCTAAAVHAMWPEKARSTR